MYKEKSFVGFIIALEDPKHKEWYTEFLNSNDPRQLFAFFQQKGFTDIPEDHCNDIIAAKDRLNHPELIPPEPCPPSRGY